MISGNGKQCVPYTSKKFAESHERKGGLMITNRRSK